MNRMVDDVSHCNARPRTGPSRISRAAVALVLPLIGFSAAATPDWPTEYNLEYTRYESPTDNDVRLNYKVNDDGEGGSASNLRSIGVNWCKPTDSSWDGQFWGPWNVGPDPQPTCEYDWKPDGGGGWWYGGHGKEIWTGGGRPGTHIHHGWHRYDLEESLAPGLWAVGINYYTDGWIFHHNVGYHNTNRVMELTAPTPPDDDEDDDDD